MKNLPNIIDIRLNGPSELYDLIDKNYKPMPKNLDGTIRNEGVHLHNNDIDALRHAYVSGLYTIEYGEKTADFLGRINELGSKLKRDSQPKSENMDLWNNAVGRKYGKKAKSRKELFDLLTKALKNGELIIDLEDKRKYRGAKIIKRLPKSLVITIQETKSGENIQYYDIGKQEVYSKEEFLALIKQGKYPNYSFKKVGENEYPISKRDRFDFNNLG
ncbi:MAG: hypothetical protein KBD63_05830 [Bacteriovoracaceae bacterium]|nr:hypothetical protein [Bacteriovoracaceae bacterium]